VPPNLTNYELTISSNILYISVLECEKGAKYMVSECEKCFLLDKMSSFAMLVHNKCIKSPGKVSTKYTSPTVSRKISTENLKDSETWIMLGAGGEVWNNNRACLSMKQFIPKVTFDYFWHHSLKN
jgi:hypothetical protein